MLPAENLDAVPDVGAYVEREVSRLDETGVERVHSTALSACFGGL